MIMLIRKDLRIAQSAAQDLRISLPGNALARRFFRTIEAEPVGADPATQTMSCAFEKLAGADGVRYSVR